MQVQPTFSNVVSASGYESRKFAWMTNQWLEDRLDELSHLGRTKAGLAKALRIAPARVTEILSGDRKVASAELQPLSEYLDMSIPAVMNKLGVTDQYAQFLDLGKFVAVEVRGYVQAGIYRQSVEIPEAERGTVMIPRIAGNPTLFGLEVRGDSMDQVFKHGDVVVCQHFLHYTGPFWDGMFVIVEHIQGDEFEATVKELWVNNGRYWLRPRSNNPAFQSTMEVPPPETWAEWDSEEYRISAVVVKSIQNHLPGT